MAWSHKPWPTLPVDKLQQVRCSFKNVLNVQLADLRTQEALGQQHNGLLPVLQTGQSHIPCGCVLGALIDQQVGSTLLTLVLGPRGGAAG